MNTSDYEVLIQGEHVQDDGLQIELGPLREDQAWWEVPLPPCPDCGGDLVWYEAGYTPGTRKCMGKPTQDGAYSADGGCGSFFDVEPEHGQVVLRRSKFP